MDWDNRIENDVLERIFDLRKEYLGIFLSEVCVGKWRGIADKDSKSSLILAEEWWKNVLGFIEKNEIEKKKISSQKKGIVFERVTRDFLRKTFDVLRKFRPAKWDWDKNRVSYYDQYCHLETLNEFKKIVREKEEGNQSDSEEISIYVTFENRYLIAPDVTIARFPIECSEDRCIAVHTPLLTGAKTSKNRPILHAVISCKVTLRSDRAQNARTEAMTLMRYRNGRTPHIVVVTAEPMPTRIASIALGTGDIDCVYHVGLYELERAVEDKGTEDAKDMLKTLIEGRRLRDISDLPFDLIT